MPETAPAPTSPRGFIQLTRKGTGRTAVAVAHIAAYEAWESGTCLHVNGTWIHVAEDFDTITRLIEEADACPF